MKWHWYGVESEDGRKYLFWFDWIERNDNRFFGYEAIPTGNVWHHMMCFWWFCICWSFGERKEK